MSEDVIRNIRISVSTETSKSQGNLNKILQTLKEIQSLTSGISFPSKKITALATSLNKLNTIKVGANFKRTIQTIKDSMIELSDAVKDPVKTHVAASFVSAIAERTRSEAKKVEAATSKERLAYQKRQAVVRNAFNKEKLLQAQMKESRLSQPKVSGTTRVTSRTAVGDTEANKTAADAVAARYQKLRELAERETEKTKAAADRLQAKVDASLKKYNAEVLRQWNQQVSDAYKAQGDARKSASDAWRDYMKRAKDDEAFSKRDAIAQQKELARQEQLVAKTIEKTRADAAKAKAKADADAAKQAKDLVTVLETYTPALLKANAAMIAFNSTFGKIAVGAKSVASGIKKVASKLASVATGIGGKAGKGMLSIAFAPFKSLGKSVSDITKRLSGFLSAVKRIAIYRAIRTVLKEITQAFREGTDNLYQYSKAINGQFAQSMDTLVTSALYAKNSLAAMASPLINALAPAVDFIVDKFVDFINTINQLIATLTGAQTWTKALKYPKAYAEAADGANGKAKELRATLLGFDEINRLDDNSKGSRGSAADNLDYSKMFEEQEVSSKVKGIAQRIKDAFLEGDFYSIGSELGGKIRDALDDIPWESIQERIKKNALSASSFINGIVDTEGLPEAIGDTLANAFNTVTLKIKTFFNDVKWKKVGKAVGDTLSTAVSKIDVQQLGEAVWSVLSAAVETALGMIETSPVIGTVALMGIGLKYGKLLGVNMGNGVANSGLTTTIQGLIPKVAAIAITAVVSFKIGNYLYNNVGWIQDLADKLVEGWNAFWETDAYKAVAHFWAEANGLADMYIQKAKIWESEQAWLLQQGLDSHQTYNVLMAQERLSTTSFRNAVRDALGLEHNAMLDILETMKETAKLTDEEYAALQKLTIKRWEINFEIKFGKTPKEFIEEGIANIKSNLQKPIDNMKETGKELGTALKNTFLSIFDNDSLSNSIRERLKNSIPSKITIDSVNSGLVSIRAYSSGGDPVTGSMFIAGERGAELVSSSSSGTSVYNRNQIAESVASGNEQTVAALNELISIGQALLEKDTSFTTDSISNALSRSNIRAGRTVVVTGG